MLTRMLFAAVLALGLLALPAAAQATSGPVVKIAQGELLGTAADGAATWLGIPYAAPPVGELRWRPPAPAPGWSGVRDAAKAGPSCERDVEDCLYLNVTAPAGAMRGARMPVMVWIHGGAFVVGNAIAAFGAAHDGTQFARKGVVTVTFNYRLGHAGWFAHPALDKAQPFGNYGLMDQIAALKWVKANIAAFGGDPNNVTVFGESAGGISVLYLMLAPDARGLFQKAIAESGFPRHMPFTLAKAEADGLKAAQAAGIEGTDAAAAEALRTLPLSKLPYAGSFTERAQPILDGRLITSGLAQGFAAGRQAKVPLIVGGNSNEASLFRPKPAQLDALPETQRAAIMAEYDPIGSGDRVRVVNEMVTDTFVTEPDRNLARIEARAGAPVWLYYFAFVPSAERASSQGARHTAEIRYVFGGPRQRLTAEEEPLSKAMNAYWAAFAKTGNPSGAGGGPWPRFDAAHEAVMNFDEAGPHVVDHEFKARLDVIEQAQGK